MGGGRGRFRAVGAAAALAAIAVAAAGGLTGCAAGAGSTAFDRPQDERDALTGELATIVSEQADPSSVRWLYTDDDGDRYYAVRSRGMDCLLVESPPQLACSTTAPLTIQEQDRKLAFGPLPPSDEHWVSIGEDLWLLPG